MATNAPYCTTLLHDALDDRAGLELGERALALLFGLGLDVVLARDDDVAPAFRVLRDGELEPPADEVGQIGAGAEIDVRAGRERAQAVDVDLDATLDGAGDEPENGLAALAAAASMRAFVSSSRRGFRVRTTSPPREPSPCTCATKRSPTSGTKSSAASS